MKKIRIGAVNWDASLTKDTYFGAYQIRSLSQAKYRTWVPFYAKLLDEERIEYLWRTPKEYEREMQYAIDARIDYFAYVWYPTEGAALHIPETSNDCTREVDELNYARRLYEQSGLTDQLGMCAILGPHPFTEGDIAELVDAFSKPYYEKLDGRPLLYVYGGYREEIIERIHAQCRARKLPVPFTVPMSKTSFSASDSMPLADALSAYNAAHKTDVCCFDELCDASIKFDRIRLATGKKIVPMFCIGWNPSPRIDRPTPWTTHEDGRTIYTKVRFAPVPSEEEFVAGAEKFSQHIKNCVKDQFAGHILTFAWNEFEEGGYLCPTYTKDGEIDDSQVRAFAEAVKVFRSELEEM